MMCRLHSSYMEMFCPAFSSLFISLLLSCFLSASGHSIPPLLGVHPLDEKYFAAKVIKCKDGSKSFSRDRLNDNFCDCNDGTDEPGTSACPAGKFYCRNLGSTPLFIFPSRVNDRYCDCCDGSDEYDSGIKCPNTCVMGGNLEYKGESHISTVSHEHFFDAEDAKNGLGLDELMQKAKGFKMLMMMEVVIIFLLVVWLIFLRRLVRSRRRRYR